MATKTIEKKVSKMKKNDRSDLTKKMTNGRGKNTPKKPTAPKNEGFTPIPLTEYKDLMDSKEVCAFLHISIDTLYKWVENRTIPHYKLTNKKMLFNRNRLIQWLESCEVGGR